MSSAQAFLDAPTVLPTDHFFPDPYDRSKASVRALFDRVCDYMNVPPETVRLRGLASSPELPLVNADGHDLPRAGTFQEAYGKFIVRLHPAQLHDPMDLVGTMAHELAHVRLLGENRLPYDAFDNELLTDLTVVFFGLGLFLANTPRHWPAHLVLWPGTDVRRPEYMTLPMYGCALALRAQTREEDPRPLRRHLKSAARAEFDQSCRFHSAELNRRQRALDDQR